MKSVIHICFVVAFPLLLSGCWEPPQEINTNAESDTGYDNNACLGADPVGNWIAVWSSNNNIGTGGTTDYNILYARSTDRGLTWSAPAYVNTNADVDTGDDMLPSLATDNRGRWIVAWQHVNPSNSELDLYYAISDNLGQTWTNPARLNTNGATDTGNDEQVQIAYGSGNTWVAVWRTSDPLGAANLTGNNIVFARSTNNGANFSTPALLNDFGAHQTGHEASPRIATNGGGTWVAVWSSASDLGTNGIDGDILFSRSTNDGANWSAAGFLNTDASDSFDRFNHDNQPDIAADAAGNFVATWYINAPILGPHTDGVFTSYSNNGGVTWSELRSISGVEGSEAAPRIACDGQNEWIITYEKEDLSSSADKDIWFVRSTDVGSTWTAPALINPATGNTNDGDESDPAIATDHFGGWFVAWTKQQTNAPNDTDIWSSRNGIFIRRKSDQFGTVDIEPSGSSQGWSAFGMNTAGFAIADFDAANGALRGIVYPSANRFRVTGWVANRSEWMPYAQVGSANIARAKYYVFTDPKSPSQYNTIPNFRIRAAHRFAQSSILEVLHHQNSDPANAPYAAELRPASNPAKPSLYRVDFDPVDVPYLAANATVEGVMRAFEAYSVDPQDSGFIEVTESSLGTFPAFALAPFAPATRTYEPDGAGAGTLKVFNSSGELSAYDLIPSTIEGQFPAIDNASQQPAYSESTAGVTLDSVLVPTNRIGILSREFFPGSSQTGRLRVEENSQYTVRFHVTSAQQSNRNCQLRLRARAIKFAWNARFEIGGASGTGGTANNTIAQQSLPGTGCLNPDHIGNEANGGWYSLIMCSPMDQQIRTEGDPDSPLSQDMPNIWNSPAGGTDAPSVRDFRVGCDLIDTLSAGPNATTEQGNFTIDNIEVRSYTLVED